MENTHHTGGDNPKNARYYAVIIQYTTKVNGERVKDVIKAINAADGVKLGNKKLNFNFASLEASEQLTGYIRNAITPFCCKTPIPVIVATPIMKLDPPLIWLGGGEVDLKLRINLSDLTHLLSPIVGDVLF
eukprot:GDKI01020330.1.p2 GENE.GDKI01020330.1~~GDKI01020330.1.p2  ORF type:complete len:131 (-),score=39.01 GDKI01020330.1:70-462(-)